MSAETTLRKSKWPRIAWGIFLLCSVALFAITADTRIAVTFVLVALAVVALSWRYPYAVLAAWVPLSFLLGIQIAVSTGYYRIGERTFGTTIDLSVGEVIALSLVAAWALRVLLLWRGRHDRHWEPWLPLALPFFALMVAHLLSILGPGQPSPNGVLNFVARYQLFLYLSCVALVVNFVRSKKRLRQVLVALTLLGAFFAADGLRNMFVFGPGGVSIRQAQPMPILEVNALGGNQHSLAETLIVGMGAALAFAALSRPASNRRMLVLWAAGLMFVTTILTFSRTAWIVLALEAVALGATVFRADVRRYRREIIYALCGIVPLGLIMLAYSLTRGAIGSLDARAALSGIAWTFFTGSPLVGVGAGTFVARVTGTYAFVADFGVPLDSHGILQKIGAEAGLLGLAALTWLVAAAVRLARRFWRKIAPGRPEHMAYAILMVTAGAAFLYQLTSTSYWTPRLWIPVGLMLAAGRLFGEREEERDPDFLHTSHG